MSKVIEYLPTSIPRILINRNHISKPPNRKSFCEDNGTNYDHENEYRNGYVFDACLLGNCDSVIQSLIKELRWEKEYEKILSSFRTIKTQLQLPHSNSGRINDINETNSYIIDTRTLIFHGALICDDLSVDGSKEGKDLDGKVMQELNELILCDGCSMKLSGKTIMRCTECFDFDLCLHCFQLKSKMHFGGKHIFTKEEC